MKYSEDFERAVTEKNKLVVVTILQGNLLVDKTFKYFDEMCEYAEKKIKKLYDEHNGEVFLEKSEWNKSYMDKQMTILIRNFSKERIKHLKNIITKLYSPKINKTANKSNFNNEYNSKNNKENNKQKNYVYNRYSEDFERAVAEKNKLVVVTILQGNLLVDKTFKHFDEMCEYAERKIKNLYDEHNGEVFLEKSEWNKSYMDRQMTILIRNFSKERIKHLKNIITKLYSPKINKTANKNNFNNEYNSKNSKENNNGFCKIEQGLKMIGEGLVEGIEGFSESVTEIIYKKK